ncbi:MAG TPA: hypothetical protein VF516_00235 [Kofleriaceae bacterium]
MTSRQHAAWIARGKPWKPARPVDRIVTKLRGYGYTVYILGNDAHLDHIPPERHCPYSETNWSAYQNRPMPDVVTAFDTMPRTVGMANRGMPTLQQLGKQMFDDKQAGHSGIRWLIGMNWGPASDRTAVRDTWRPSHVRTTSSDAGHIHGECDSSMITSVVGDDYDPVARFLGQGNTYDEQEEDDMGGFLAQDDKTGAVYHVVNGESFYQTQKALNDKVYLTAEGLYPFDKAPKTHANEWFTYTTNAGSVWIRKGWNAETFGNVAGPASVAAPGN